MSRVTNAEFMMKGWMEGTTCTGFDPIRVSATASTPSFISSP